MAERCNGCRWSKIVYAGDQWNFVGCYHEPYKGKWVAEIKDCPNGKVGVKVPHERLQILH